jgi:hypothetical protein
MPRKSREESISSLKLTAAGFVAREAVLDTIRGSITRGRSLAAVR